MYKKRQREFRKLALRKIDCLLKKRRKEEILQMGLPVTFMEKASLKRPQLGMKTNTFPPSSIHGHEYAGSGTSCEMQDGDWNMRRVSVGHSM